METRPPAVPPFEATSKAGPPQVQHECPGVAIRVFRGSAEVTESSGEIAELKIADSWATPLGAAPPTSKRPSSTSGRCSSSVKDSAASPPTSTAA